MTDTQFLQHLQNDVTFNPQIIYDLGLTRNLSGICLELTWNGLGIDLEFAWNRAKKSHLFFFYLDSTRNDLE